MTVQNIMIDHNIYKVNIFDDKRHSHYYCTIYLIHKRIDKVYTI